MKKMKCYIEKGISIVLAQVIILSLIAAPVYAEPEVPEADVPVEISTEDAAPEEPSADYNVPDEKSASDEESLPDDAVQDEPAGVVEEEPAVVAPTSDEPAAEEPTVEDLLLEEQASAGETVNGQFTPAELRSYLGVTDLANVDLATVRFIYSENGETTYGLADISGSVSDGITYSFTCPVNGFTVTEGASFTNQDPAANATVVAACFRTDVWDGAVDVSWYNEDDAEFHIYNPAEFAGVAAIVNGTVDHTIDGFEIKGERIAEEDKDEKYVYEYDLKYLISIYNEETELIAGGKGPAHTGAAIHDFSNRTIYLENDMDMGGAEGAEIDHFQNYNPNMQKPEDAYPNAYDYPDWAPIGGIFLQDLDVLESANKACFNGTLDGQFHRIERLYCHRWSYPKRGTTAYAYTEGTGLVGRMGGYYDDPAVTLTVDPAVRNLSLSGYVYGRRSVGGIVGSIGRGSSGSSVDDNADNVHIENCANYAYCYATDSKGVGGIIGTVWTDGVAETDESPRKGIDIINCYNTANVTLYEYTGCASGIIGENCGANIYCCYNRGFISTDGHNRGRGIGSDNAGTCYTVSDCFYLEGYYDCPDPEYFGYYDYNAAPSLSIETTELTDEQMRNGYMLSKLNVNGNAYVEGDDGYPVLFWEKPYGGSSIAIEQPENGTITEVIPRNTYKTGDIIYLHNVANVGWNFRCYTLNGKELTGNYATLNGDAVITAVYESAKAGVLRIEENPDCTVSITKIGIIVVDGQSMNVNNYPVNNGDSIYEGDKLMVTVTLNEGAVPDDEDLIYQGSDESFPQPYSYIYTYTDTEPIETSSNVYTVDSTINQEGASLTLAIGLLTSQKLWLYESDVSWYNEDDTTFTLTTPRQLAGLDRLVTEGNTFEGKTVKLGADLDFTNDDGTNGRRFWNGIGDSGHQFAGTFDGNSHTISNLNMNEAALFANCVGSSSSKRAVVKNVTVRGTGTGNGLGGIVAKGTYTTISGCSNYCVLDSDKSLYFGGILAQDTKGCTVEKCYNYACISGSSNSGMVRAGGIVGYLSSTGKITQCINTGNITSTSTRLGTTGGICGTCNGEISKCGNYGNITGAGGGTGGVAGSSQNANSLLLNTYNVGTVTYDGGESSYGDSVGGIIGYAQRFVVKYSYNYGDVKKKSGVMTQYFGSFFGVAGTVSSSGVTPPKSTDITTGVYCLNTAEDPAVGGTALSALNTSASYYAGLASMTAAQYKSSSGLCSSINHNSSGGTESVFTVKNGLYPEIAVESSMHKHTGGTATCSTLAVCDECGLYYGNYNSENHEKFKTVNVKAPEWMTDGYTGDQMCTGCGAIVGNGTAVPADTTQKMITVFIQYDGEIIYTRDMTIAQLDALAETEPIVYQYGTNNDTLFVSNRYVPIASILGRMGYEENDMNSVTVTCTGSESTYTKEHLDEHNRYYPVDGGDNYTEVPAAVVIYQDRGTGNVEDILKTASYGTLYFGYGISEQEHIDKYVGGLRIATPVIELTFDVKEIKEPPEEPVGITLDKESAYVTVKDKITLKATVTPEESAGSVTWASSDPKVASVDKNGKVTGVKQGKAMITASVSAGDGSVCSASCDIRVLFKDVPADHNYFSAIYWAADNGITGGYTGAKAGLFGPSDPVQRGQVVMFLWRMAGEPEPANMTKQKFKDVPVKHSFFKAIQWAYEQGITAGYKDGNFGVKDNCTRGQIAMFLWRYKGQPEPSGTGSDFKDVPKTHGFYKAIKWASEQKITAGYSNGTFGPSKDCTRGQMVMFLWRAEGSPEIN